MKIVLISCTKSKQNYACPARELYSKSDLFQKEYHFAKSFANKIYILSAKYGLVDENEILSPYNQTLCGASVQTKKDWARKVLKQMEETFDMDSDEFVFLAGRNYTEYLVSAIKSKYDAKVALPLENVGSIGKQKQFLKQRNDENGREKI